MSPKKFDAQEWGRRLETGKQDEPTLSLAARLAKSRPDPRPLPPDFQEALRDRLLNRRAVYPVGQWAFSSVGLLLLASVVFFFWSSLAHWQQPIQPGATGAESPPVITSQATATPTPFPPTLEPPSAQPVSGADLIAVDLWQSTAVSHPQVDGRFNLALTEAQEQVAYPLLSPTFLPAGFQFVGAAVTVIYPNEPLEPGVGMVFAAMGGEEGPILDFHQHPALGNGPNFDAHEYEDTHVTIRPVTLSDFVGDFRLDGRAGRSTLRWQVDGFRYTLTMSGELAADEEVLVQIAASLQANSRWLAPLINSGS